MNLPTQGGVKTSGPKTGIPGLQNGNIARKDIVGAKPPVRQPVAPKAKQPEIIKKKATQPPSVAGAKNSVIEVGLDRIKTSAPIVKRQVAASTSKNLNSVPVELRQFVTQAAKVGSTKVSEQEKRETAENAQACAKSLFDGTPYRTHMTLLAGHKLLVLHLDV